MTAVDVALDPVVGRAMAVFFQRLDHLGLGAIQLGALPEDFFDPARLRAVRVFGGFAFGVVLAVDGDPLLGDHARGEP